MKHRFKALLLGLLLPFSGFGQEPNHTNSVGGGIDTAAERTAFKDAIGVPKVYSVIDYGASGKGYITTTGAITSGTASLVVASTQSYEVGQGILVAGAGTAGARLVTTIQHIAGSTITLASNASTTVSGAAVKHDDTAAINATIAAAMNGGGGTVFLPGGTPADYRGRYNCAGALDASTNSVLTFPQNIDYELSRPTVTLMGEATGWMTDGYQDIGAGGVSLDFRDVTASGTMPSAIAAAPFATPAFPFIYSQWNNINVVIDNLMFVVKGNTISALNFHNALTLRVGDGVAVHAAATGAPASLLEPALVDPTTSEACGIVFPAILNNITQDCGSCVVSGFYKGIVPGEHTYFRRPSIIFGKYGLFIPDSAHLISGSLSIENCEAAVVTTGIKYSVLNLEVQVEMSDLVKWWKGVWGFLGGNIERGQIIHSSYNKNGDTYPNNFPISNGLGITFRDLRNEYDQPFGSEQVLYRNEGIGVGTTNPLTLGSGFLSGRAVTVFNASGGATIRAQGSTNAASYLIHTGAPANARIWETQTVNGLWKVSTVADDLLSATTRLALPTTGGMTLVSRTPSSATDTGTANTFCFDTNYIYICTATNTWKRVAISTW